MSWGLVNGDLVRSTTLPLHPPLSVIKPHITHCCDFHGFLQWIWLSFVRQKEQEREKEMAHIKLGYNSPQELSETKKRRTVQHEAASLGKDTTPTPACRPHWASNMHYSMFREEFYTALLKLHNGELGIKDEVHGAIFLLLSTVGCN